MTFTPRPNTGSTWWATRLRAAAARAAHRRDIEAFMRRPQGPLLRKPAPGEGVPQLLSLTRAELARTRTAPAAPPLAQAIVGELLDTPTAAVHDHAADMGAFTPRSNDDAVPRAVVAYDPATEGDDSAGGVA